MARSTGLVKAEKRWRTDLGKDPEVGEFIGYQSKVVAADL